MGEGDGGWGGGFRGGFDQDTSRKEGRMDIPISVDGHVLAGRFMGHVHAMCNGLLRDGTICGSKRIMSANL